MHHKSSAQHANGTHVGLPRSPDKHALAEQTHQEGFIDTDPSPAVLKTEFPPKLEPHLEQPHKAQPDNVDGENAGVAVFGQVLSNLVACIASQDMVASTAHSSLFALRIASCFCIF